MPVVSILAPCHNHARFLGEAIRSARQQTLASWELILIDDGSRDDSVQEALRHAEGDHRIQVLVNERPLGAYGTLQRALDLARSELVAVLNAEDMWAPDKLARQTALLDRMGDASFCYTLGRAISPGGALKPNDSHGDWPRTERQDLLPWLLSENRIVASSVMFRRKGLSFDRTCRVSGDWVALVEASLRGRAAFINDPLAYWRTPEGGAPQFTEGRILEEIRVLEAMRAHWTSWQSRRDPTEFGRHRGRSGMNLLAWYLTLGMRRQALALLPDVLRFRPFNAALRRMALVPAPQKRAIRRLFPDAADEILEFRLRRMRRQAARQLPLIFFDPGPVEPR